MLIEQNHPHPAQSAMHVACKRHTPFFCKNTSKCGNRMPYIIRLVQIFDLKNVTIVRHFVRFIVSSQYGQSSISNRTAIVPNTFRYK